MRLLHKALALSTVGLTALYLLARQTIPPTVYVLVAVEDASGEPVAIPEQWTGWLVMVDGEIRPGATIRGTDDLGDPERPWNIESWKCRFVDGTTRVAFACRPDSDAAFVAMTQGGGCDEVALRLPPVSRLIPWRCRRVRLRLPQPDSEWLGQLQVTVMDADGTVVDRHPGLKLLSPIGRIPVLFQLDGPHGPEPFQEGEPVRYPLPAGHYRLDIAQWVGLTCGNGAPSRDRHVRPDLEFVVEPSQLTRVALERPHGTHLDLELELVGDDGAFAAGRAAFLEEWERSAFHAASLPPHPWRAEARLQRLGPSGLPEGPAERYPCRWAECRHVRPRHSFPVSGSIEGLRQYRAGRYRLNVDGAGIQPVATDIVIPDLDGGSLSHRVRLNSRSGWKPAPSRPGRRSAR